MTEYAQFAGATFLSVAVLVGSFFFVLTSPGGCENESWSGRERRGS